MLVLNGSRRPANGPGLSEEEPLHGAQVTTGAVEASEPTGAVPSATGRSWALVMGTPRERREDERRASNFMVMPSRRELEQRLEEREVDEPDEAADDGDDAGLEHHGDLADARLELGVVVTADLLEDVLERSGALADGHDLRNQKGDGRVVEARCEVLPAEHVVGRALELGGDGGVEDRPREEPEPL